MSTTRRDNSGAPPAQPSLIYLVGRANQGITREMRSRLVGWELSVPEYTALSVLGNRPGLSNAQLARRTMITPQSMIQILAKLERRKLVRRTLDPDHQRILRAELTTQGRAMLTKADLVIAEIQERVLDGVGERDRRIVMDVLLRATAVLARPNGAPGWAE
jgi:DNA-binding MarR family transcriptional regulator